MSDKQNEPDKTGARNPDLAPEQQGITQDEANKVGDLRDPANRAGLINRTFGNPGDAREVDVNRVGQVDPPEAAEQGGAAEQGQSADVQSQQRMAQAVSRDQRPQPQNKPK